jgi:hypothetical protein
MSEENQTQESTETTLTPAEENILTGEPVEQVTDSDVVQDEDKSSEVSTETTPDPKEEKPAEPEKKDEKPSEEHQESVDANAQNQPEEYRRQPDSLSECETLVNSDKFDPIEDSPKVIKALMGKVRELEAKANEAHQFTQQQQARNAEDQYWSGFEKSNPGITRDQGSKLFQEQVRELEKQGYRGEALRGAATVAWQFKIDAMKKTASTTTTEKKPVTPIHTPVQVRQVGKSKPTPEQESTPTTPVKPSVTRRALEAIGW